MTGSSVVALIGSPYQALSLLEYVRAANVGSGLVFVTKLRDPSMTSPIYHTLAHLHGFTFQFRTPNGFGGPQETTAGFAAGLADIARAEFPDARLVIGDYRDTLGWRLARDLGRSGADVVVLDDGAVSMTIDRSDGSVFPLEWSEEAEQGGFLPLPGVTFFTAYAKHLKPAPSDSVLLNEWVWLRSRYADLPQSSSVSLVIGQGMSRSGMFDDETDLRVARALVRRAQELHPTTTPLYVAHRGESAEKLRGLAAQCDVVQFDVPVELMPVQAGVLPAGVVGHFSTALTSFAAIAPDGFPIHAVRLPIHELRRLRRPYRPRLCAARVRTCRLHRCGRHRRMTVNNEAPNPQLPVVQKLRVRYAKRDRLRFTSHRDFARAFERAVRRAGVPIGFSSGFSPHPKISYANAAPTGSASEAEFLEIGLTELREPDEVLRALDGALPPGLDILDVVVVDGPGSLADRLEASTWRIELADANPDQVASAVSPSSLPRTSRSTG